MLPMVALFHEFWDSQLRTYDAIVKKVIELGLPPLVMPSIPVRRGAMKIKGQCFFRRGAIDLHVMSSTGSERGLRLAILSLNLCDKSARLPDVVAEMSDLLSAVPEFPGASAQYIFEESDAGRSPVSLAQTSAWNGSSGALVYVGVSPFETGTMISQMVQTAK